MAALTLKQLVQSDLNLDKDVTCPISGTTMSIDLTLFKSKFIKSFLCSFKEHVMCLTYSDNHIDMMMDQKDPQDVALMQQGCVSPWQNLQPMFLEEAPWDTIIPEGREEEFLGIFIEKTLAAVKQQNGL